MKALASRSCASFPLLRVSLAYLRMADGCSCVPWQSMQSTEMALRVSP